MYLGVCISSTVSAVSCPVMGSPAKDWKSRTAVSTNLETASAVLAKQFF